MLVIALYNKIVDWLAACIDMDTLSNMPKRDTVMKELKN